MRCGLIQGFGPKGWTHTIHVWIGKSKTCCCGHQTRAALTEDEGCEYHRPLFVKGCRDCAALIEDSKTITYDELRGHVKGGAMRSKSPAPGQDAAPTEDTP